MKDLFIMYERDEQNRPVGTRCLVYRNGRMAFGKAVCSDKDNPCKKIGKDIALGRALKALQKDTPFSVFARKGDYKFLKCFNDVKNVPSRLTEAERRWISKKTEPERKLEGVV